MSSPPGQCTLYPMLQVDADQSLPPFLNALSPRIEFPSHLLRAEHRASHQPAKVSDNSFPRITINNCGSVLEIKTKFSVLCFLLFICTSRAPCINLCLGGVLRLQFQLDKVLTQYILGKISMKKNVFFWALPE